MTLRLVARAARWRPEGPEGPELGIFTFAVEGCSPQVPGPLIRVPVGTEIRAAIRNALPKPLRVYGFQDRPSDALDSLELMPGETRELRYGAGAAGTYLYWGRTTRDTFAIGQYVDGLLSGAIVVDSAPDVGRTADRVLVIGLRKARETPPGTPVEQREETLVVNGVAWPHTERLSYQVGDTVHWRVVNATRRFHPMHLHGFYYRVDARGTAVRDMIYEVADRRQVTERLLPGTTMSLTWSPHTPGNWLFHCHLVEHMSARVNPRASAATWRNATHRNHAIEGMSGLVVGIRVHPQPGDVVRPAPAPRRGVRLFVTERARVFGEASGCRARPPP
jgi:manganese oxidase